MPVMTSAVGERIRLRRQQLGLRQADLAARVGVSESAVLGWEKDRFFPSRHQGALEDVLGISLAAANGTTPPPPADPRERELWDLAVQDMPPAQAWEVVEEYRRRRRRIA
jgi:transcriptional regulator with XRE-family HTH domain